MKFLGTVVNIYQQQVVQQQILDKVVLVKAFLISHKQVLDLECYYLSHHVYVIPAALGEQDVFQLMLVKHLEELIALDHLAVRGRIHKRDYGDLILFRIRKRGRQHLAFGITDTQICSGNSF